eukprot:14698436-Alexandrium_andersonii.AAC.1
MPNASLRASESEETRSPTLSEVGTGGAAVRTAPPAGGSALWRAPMLTDSEPPTRAVKPVGRAWTATSQGGSGA